MFFCYQSCFFPLALLPLLWSPTWSLLFLFKLFFIIFSRFFRWVCSGVVEVANLFHISPGSVNNCTMRFVRAVKKLGKDYIVCPSPQTRQDLADYAWQAFGFRGCIGSTDGSQVPLTYAPRTQPWTYWDRHDRYSIHVLLVCDHHRNIISVTLGFTGAAGDALVQDHAAWSQRPGEHFSLLEHLLGDKGMHYTVWVVGPYKGTEGESKPNKNFNWKLARFRALSEHTFGMSKGRWASLHELRLPIGSERDFLRAWDWVMACCVLHNVCNSVTDGDMPVAIYTDAPVDPMPADDGADESRTRFKRHALTFVKTMGH